MNMLMQYLYTVKWNASRFINQHKHKHNKSRTFTTVLSNNDF